MKQIKTPFYGFKIGEGKEIAPAHNNAKFGVLGALFLALIALNPAFCDIGPSHFYRTNTINGGVDEVPLRISQAEDVTLDQWTVDQSGAVDLGTNTIPVWYLSSRTNLSLVYIVSTGSVQNATGGHSRVSWTWRNTIVPATRFISTIRAYDSVNGTNRYIGTLAQFYVDVSAVPDTNGYVTVVPSDLSKSVTSNQMGSGAVWNGSQWTFGVAAGAVVGVSISGGGAFSSSTNGSVVSLVVNTNVPAETDPIWTATSNNYATVTTASGLSNLVATAQATGVAAHVMAQMSLNTGNVAFAWASTGITASATAQATGAAAYVWAEAARTNAEGRIPKVASPISGTMLYWNGTAWANCTNIVFLGTNFLFYWTSTNSPARFPCDGE